LKLHARKLRVCNVSVHCIQVMTVSGWSTNCVFIGHWLYVLCGDWSL